MPHFNIEERLQLARDICAAPDMQALVRQAHAAVLAELVTVNFSQTTPPQYSEQDVPGGYQLEATSFLRDGGHPKPLELRVALSMFTDGLCRGRCQLVVTLHERVPVVGNSAGLRGARVGHFCAFTTPIEQAFGDAAHDVPELHRVIAQLGFSPTRAWPPGLAQDVANAFCEQVAP